MNIQETKTKNGWFKVYWEFLDNLSPEAALLFSYLITIEPIMKSREGEYFRLSDSFIQEKFLTWSSYTIRTKLEEIESRGYIHTKQLYQMERAKKCKTRWIKLIYTPDEST